MVARAVDRGLIKDRPGCVTEIPASAGFPHPACGGFVPVLDQPITRSYGPNPHSPTLTITTVCDWQGIALTVTTPAYSSVLSRTFAHAQHNGDATTAARHWYRHLRDSAQAGTPLHRIESDTSALIAAAVAAGV